jgi:hypothetical protein
MHPPEPCQFPGCRSRRFIMRGRRSCNAHWYSLRLIKFDSGSCSKRILLSRRTANVLFSRLINTTPMPISGYCRMDAPNICVRPRQLSWFGFARTCDRVGLLSTPALGLSGWLAHSPDRPRAIAYNAWTDQLIIWLQEDLKTSAWIWHRLVSFMRPHKSYLLAPGSRAPGRTCRVALNSTVSA